MKRVIVDHLMKGSCIHEKCISPLTIFQIVENPLLYVEKMLDRNHRGVLSANELADDSIFRDVVGGNLTHLLVQSNVTGYQNRMVEGERIFTNISSQMGNNLNLVFDGI